MSVVADAVGRDPEKRRTRRLAILPGVFLFFAVVSGQIELPRVRPCKTGVASKAPSAGGKARTVSVTRGPRLGPERWMSWLARMPSSGPGAIPHRLDAQTDDEYAAYMGREGSSIGRVTNYLHDTSILSCQSANLFQDGTTRFMAADSTSHSRCGQPFSPCIEAGILQLSFVST
jgi:hypothetical protein